MSNLLQLKNGTKAFAMKTLFQSASFSVNAGEKIGVIGPNGAGKTTLFKILVGQDHLDSGEITRASGLKIGYLAQEDRWNATDTVESYLVANTRAPIWDLKAAAPDFGLKEADFAKPLLGLSGGYRMRVKLLQLMASGSDLLLLDEPTNYLDLETLVVLENFLLESTTSFLLISHDREFLKRTTDHILEIEGGQMTKFAGQIDDYFEQKEMLREQLLKSAVSAQAKRNEILAFAARFGAKATKARQAQSRLKRLEKMEIIEARELPLQARIRLPEPVRTGKIVIRTEACDLGYGERTVIGGLNMELGKGDHLGVVGVNGAGKSTLLKALAGELAPINGKFEFGQGVEIAYFAQHVAERLEPGDTVLEAMGTFAHPDVKRQEILDLAGCLLFSGDDAEKRVSVLSGGEKSRVALGQILLKRASCLLLDEPTNHLDFHTVEALTQALSHYNGTIVIVSHDRGFVRRTASKILEIRDGRAEIYPGSYDEYVWSVQKGVLSARHGLHVTPAANANSPVGVAGVDTSGKFNFKDSKKQLEKELRGLEKEMLSTEGKIEELKKRVLEDNETLVTATGSAASEAARALGKHQAEIEVLEARYLECLERHDSVSREIVLLESRRTD